MITARLTGLFLILMLAACGSKETSLAVGGTQPATLASVPATLEGELDMSVTEGDAEADGGEGEITFGALRAGGDMYLVEVEEKTLAAAGISVDEVEVKVRATLGARSAHLDDSYVITSLTRVK